MGEGELLFSYGAFGGDELQLDTFGRVVHAEQDVLPGYVTEAAPATDPRLVDRIGPVPKRRLRHTGDALDKVVGRTLHLSVEELDAADDLVTPLLRRTPVRLASGRSAWVYVAVDA
ncbi:gamma-glutamylcyclotransferase [Microbacterium sp. Sa4CUA7]|uniref:Gamma-glutamylcyclotransferase n=1 Tax=Microbacterium pullorum TaxID=2762236 RepID=A0ABR8RZ18_9MICO|nr:gamma-glutamylcyclotransferase [Microbacterium pullorum]MBD7956462.1 gamma-glutamylcyclotransferase [Microbacterium pullorum]